MITIQRSNEQLLLAALNGRGWLAALASRILDDTPQHNYRR